MTNKYDAPQGPPPSYGIDPNSNPARINSPAPIHSAPSSDYYGASPYQQPATTYQGNGYPPPNGYPAHQQQQGGGYYASGPQMGYAPQGGYYGQQQQMYGNPGQGEYYGQPQGQYVDGRGRGGPGFMEAMLASLACCCCLDACLFF